MPYKHPKYGIIFLQGFLDWDKNPVALWPNSHGTLTQSVRLSMLVDNLTECRRKSRYCGLISRAASSPTLLADVIATRNSTFHEKSLNSAIAAGSKGCLVRHRKTNGRSQAGTLSLIGGYTLQSPFKNFLDNG